MILLYSPFPRQDDAEAAANDLQDKKLIACANILPPSTSLFIWEGEKKSEEEVILLCKTADDKAKRAAQELEALHPYDCPCVLTIECTANDAYERWLRASVDTHS